MKKCFLLSVAVNFCLLVNAQNVGIGTNNPLSKFHVNGSVRITADYKSAVNAPNAAQNYTMINALTVTMPASDSIARVYDPAGPAGNYPPNITANFLAASNNAFGSCMDILIENLNLGIGDYLVIFDGGSNMVENPIVYRAGSDAAVTNLSNVTVNLSGNVGYCVFTSNNDLSTGTGFSLLVTRKYMINSGQETFLKNGHALAFYPQSAALRVGKMSTAGIGSNSIAMGNLAEASGDNAVAIGNGTKATGALSTALGYKTEATGINATAMGNEARADGIGSFAFGYRNVVYGNYAVAMGYSTSALGDYGTATGKNTSASGESSFATGDDNYAGGKASVAMGNHLFTLGDYSTAMGSYIRMYGDGSFGIGDRSSTTDLYSTTENRMFMRFANGYKLYTNATTTAGVQMSAGENSWSTISDSTKKENYLPADGKSFLSKISSMLLGSWNYKDQDKRTYRHYGPMAQEMYSRFGNDGIGTIGNDTTIATADIDGVMMIAIQELIKEKDALQQSQEKLIEKNKKLEQQNEKVEARLQKLEAIIQNLSKNSL